MGLLGIFGVKAKKEMAGIQQDIIGLMAKWDWDTVSEADLIDREKVLDQVTQKMVAAQRTYEKEQKEYEIALKDYNEKLADAEQMNISIIGLDAQINASSDPTIATPLKEKRAKFDAHLNKLLAEIEASKPEVDREEQEAIDAKADFDMFKEAVERAANQLVMAKNTMKDKKRELDRLSVQEERVKEREQNRLVLAGIREKTDSLGTITTAIDNEIQKKKDRIAASEAKTSALDRQLHTTESSVTTDPDILAALGKKPVDQPTLSASDRLSALKRK